jgi:hypothetical protein
VPELRWGRRAAGQVFEQFIALLQIMARSALKMLPLSLTSEVLEGGAE